MLELYLKNSWTSDWSSWKTARTDSEGRMILVLALRNYDGKKIKGTVTEISRNPSSLELACLNHNGTL